MNSSQSLRRKLETIHLEKSYELDILNAAINKLDNGENEFTVLKEVKAKFRKLALNKNYRKKC
ncbi:hypothetical protein C7H83_10505 [Tetragenococcus halophilus]|uniref:Uncharacterized protein n=1 Tax=Tetragenococcus halophilus TaxID=51669 RepID=A0A3G5FKI5_TETHA|nr:hypothetical protein [Tetragenococcus halophilus]AYW50867.1 hypothetical protein C7H83_10505 [Tetragenococcus halophilus]GBD63738.1 hypothetical protein TEHD23766T_1165 [Tetragenococcus halophilus subsp. flandriensis]GMG66149.1 hypothetical protein TEHIT2_13400 [Tetragenococcus halophilus]